jgi:hypothetical protein
MAVEKPPNGGTQNDSIIPSNSICEYDVNQRAKVLFRPIK